MICFVFAKNYFKCILYLPRCCMFSTIKNLEFSGMTLVANATNIVFESQQKQKYILNILLH